MIFRSYLDTRLDASLTKCEEKEIAFTIGAAVAYRIEPGKWHSTFIATSFGTVDSDKFKLNAQLGVRVPSGCTSTWCSFGTENKILVPAWNSSVPGKYAWGPVY